MTPREDVVDLDDFRREVLADVRAAADAGREFTRTCFVAEAGKRLEEAEELQDFEPCHFEGLGKYNRRLGVDGYSWDDCDNSLSLVIADFSDTEDLNSFGRVEVDRCFGMLKGYFEEAVAGRLTDGTIEEAEHGFGLALDITRWYKDLERIRLYLVSDRLLSWRSRDLPEELIAGKPAEFHVWDIGRFQKAHESATGRDELQVNFTEFGEGLCFLEASGENRAYQGFLCMIPGGMLADIYDRFGSRLLEGNVRSFLSVKGNVNKGIRSTILNHPEMFFAYNNGISATAENILIDDKSFRIISAKNFQIVNGGQTTASLAMAKRKDKASLDEVFVQMKLSVLPPEKAESMIPDIARFANSQNKINEADFFSNHPFHIRLEEFSRRLLAPAYGGAQHQTHWFYERARGQYLNEQSRLTITEKKKFLLVNPRNQVITKTDIAKFENTWRCMPHKVSLGSQKNFRDFAEWITKRWEDDPTQFHEEYYRNLVALAILFRSTERLVGEQEWYQSGYRANIVTYALSKLSDMVETQAPGWSIDFRRIWERQTMPDELTEQLAINAKKVMEVLTAEDRKKENVTEWAKMPLCWERVQEMPLKLHEKVIDKLVTLASLREAKTEAKKQRKEDDKIAIHTQVVTMGAQKWKRILNWAERNRLLTEEHLSILAVAAGMSGGKIPSEKQSLIIWEIKNKLEEEGCPDLN